MVGLNSLRSLWQRLFGPPDPAAAAANRQLEERTRRERELAMGVPPSESVVGTPMAEGRWREPTLWNLNWHYQEVLPPHPDDRRWIGDWQVEPPGDSIADALLRMAEADVLRGQEDLANVQHRIYGRTSPPRPPIPADQWVVVPAAGESPL